jgi:hypothetical protein
MAKQEIPVQLDEQQLENVNGGHGFGGFGGFGGGYSSGIGGEGWGG